MADFQYIALDNEGKQVKGTIVAGDLGQARTKIRMDGLKPISVKAQSLLTKDIQIGGGGSVKSRDLSVFCRQFASVLTAGVTVVEALRMLSDQTENKALKKALAATRDNVQQGDSLAEAMAKQPKVFNEMFVNMVNAGEQSGSLETCIKRMGIQFEKSAKLSGLVKKAMIYPIAVLVIAIGVLIVMSVKVIPTFADMFSSMGTELPVSTRAALAVSDFLITKWYILIAIVVALVLLIKAVGKTEKGKAFYGTLAIKAPIFGQLNIKSNSAKFARTMSTLVSSGMGIPTALEITAKAMSNVLYKYALKKAKEDVEQGIPLSVPIRKATVFPSMVNNMLAIGEETGSVEGMLDKVADYYEEETELMTASMTELMQPIIIVVLGVIVGWMVLAMYQPMISMYGGMENM